MIGGKDIHVEVPSGAASLDFAVRAIRFLWPCAVFAANGSDEIVTRYEDLEFHETSEIIAYRDKIACERWRAIGYDPSLRGSMVYLISDPTDLTLVVESDPSDEINRVVSSILDGLARTFRLYKHAA